MCQAEGSIPVPTSIVLIVSIRCTMVMVVKMVMVLTEHGGYKQGSALGSTRLLTEVSFISLVS